MGLGVTLLVVFAGIGIYSTIRVMARKYPEISGMTIADVDISGHSNGVYEGQFSYGQSSYKVKVHVADGNYTSIEVNTNRRDKYARIAEAVVERIIEQQSLAVEVVSGATRSSKAILKAVENAVKER